MAVRTVRDELQSLCDISLDDATGITWDLYRPNQKDKLELKVRLALYPDSVTVDQYTGQTRIAPSTNSEANSRNALVQHVSDKIWDQMKHTGGTCLRMSIVYIGLVNANSFLPRLEQDYMIRPLFRTMKCLDLYTRSAHDRCMVFVDEFGWVYQNWTAFKAETLYPDTQIVAPVAGVFSRENSGLVILTSFKAPKTAEEIEREMWTNITMTVGGLGSAAVLGAAAFFPVTAPFVWGAIGIGTVVGLVTGAKSVAELVNRDNHEQDISLADKESRAHWLAISGTVVGFAASGAASVLRGAAAAGNVSRTILYTSNSLFASSIFINGVSVGNSIWTVSTDDRPVTTGDILQISASLFLFTHSVYNFQTAQGVIRDTQAQHLTDYKQTLSKNGQKRFQNRLNGRVRENGVARGTGDTIRNLNTAEHYNNNFRGTAAYQTSAGVAENQRLHSNLSNSFVRYVPESMQVLATICVVIVRNDGEEVFELLKKMAEMILDRLGTGAGLSIEDVLHNCYEVIGELAKQGGYSIKEVLWAFNGLTYEDFPIFLRKWFDIFIPAPGPVKCGTCGGQQYPIQ